MSRNATHFRAAGTRAGLAICACAASLLAMSACPCSASAPGSTPSHAASPARAAVNYANLPLSFEPNQGQADPSIGFLARGAGFGLYLTGNQAVLALHKTARPNPAEHIHGLSQFGIAPPSLNPSPETDAPQESAQSATTPQNSVTDVLTMQLVGASPRATVSGEDRLPGTSSYFLGNDPSQWHAAIPNYARVHYRAVYPGVDLVYYGNRSQLEYDFVVAPHAATKPIRLKFPGANSLRIDHEGNLVISAHDSEIAFHKPVNYQLDHGRRISVAGRFELLADNSVGFAIGAYDHARPLIIDPVLAYSTFLGGTAAEFVVGSAIDASGNAYVTGLTVSIDFPLTPGAFQTVNYATPANAVSTAFISKFNPSGTALLYSTFLGGNAIADTLHNQGDFGHAIAVDSKGEAYVAGYTYSNNFPITSGAFQKSNVPSTHGLATGFVTKLNATGSALLYSTYLGGSTLDEPGSIVIDSSGDAFISGETFSSDFPVTPGAFQTVNKSAKIDGPNLFVTKLNPAGSALVYSTYIGGSAENGSVFSNLILTIPIAIDQSGSAYVAGFTVSADFPVTKGAFQAVDQSGGYVATVSKLNPAGSALEYSTFLGGDTNSSYPQAIAVDSAGNAYIGGITACTDFPVTAKAFQKINKADTNTSTSPNANQNGFVTKLNPTGSALVFSTYLGGTTGPWGGDSVYGLAIDSAGDVYVSGSAMSDDFPVTANAYQPKNHGASHCCDYLTYTDNAFLTEFNPAGSALIYSTYLGGSGTQNPQGAGGFGDEAYTLALGSGGHAVIAGYTSSPNFPVSSFAFETKYHSQQNMGFVALFDMGAAPTSKDTETTLVPSANSVVPGTALTFTATVAPVSGSATPTGSIVFSIDEATVATVTLNSAGKATYSTSKLAPGAHYILASYSGSSTLLASGDGFTEYVTPIMPKISPPGGTYTSQQTVTITSPTPTSALYYTLNGSAPSMFTTPYKAPIVINQDRTIEAVAIAASDANSTVNTQTYTIIGSPWVLAEPATAVTTAGATLNALVSSLGLTGTYHFQYGPSKTSLNSATQTQTLAASTGNINAAATLTGLKAATTYYFQVVVNTSGGICSGQILSFTTK